LLDDGNDVVGAGKVVVVVLGGESVVDASATTGGDVYTFDVTADRHAIEGMEAMTANIRASG
jgi:hypothetical protein